MSPAVLIAVPSPSVLVPARLAVNTVPTVFDAAPNVVKSVVPTERILYSVPDSNVVADCPRVPSDEIMIHPPSYVS